METSRTFIGLIRYVIQRTDRTLRLCLILLCLAGFSAVDAYLYSIVLREVTRP